MEHDDVFDDDLDNLGGGGSGRQPLDEAADFGFVDMVKMGMSFIQQNGWYLVGIGIIGYILYNKLMERLRHESVYNVDRVRENDIQRKLARLRQQQVWDEQAKSVNSDLKKRRREEEHKKKTKKFNEKKRVHTPFSDQDNGRVTSSLKDRYPAQFKKG